MWRNSYKKCFLDRSDWCARHVTALRLNLSGGKMQKPSELDIAQLKHEMRQMYMHLGFTGSLQVLYEMLVGAQTLAEVIAEERKNNAEEKSN
jgi:hypothetical protein